jgi:hypothetical protein
VLITPFNFQIDQVSTSCGFSVPYFEFKGHRPILNEHFATKARKFEEGNEKESMDHYWAFKSQRSIDGLPGMKRGVDFAKKEGVAPLRKMVGRAGMRVSERYRGRGEGVNKMVMLMIGLLVGVMGVEVLRRLGDRHVWV